MFVVNEDKDRHAESKWIQNDSMVSLAFIWVEFKTNWKFACLIEPG
jgi:hypothetical protein